ncbi:RNA 2',3'-cyclic phosphodiesterase [Millisia brevis]|uniref:RNA 2',3'-cyclic phosphodiesterase n=1 Tax=Millisia brevis TaxID=264148 RepID=UPI001FE04634|nr:RNA 2',3'-cyclic phosphodiesterase [Millisia brevis]
MFVAAVPPESVVEDLDEFLEPRRSAGRDAGLRWTRSEHYHLTLAFFESVPEYRLDELIERLHSTADRHLPIRLALRSGGAFPDPAAGRALWAGVHAEAEDLRQLDALSVGARNAGSVSGATVDGTRFRPHLTIARTSRPTDLIRWVNLLAGYSGPQWSVDRIELIESHLGQGPNGSPRYETVETIAVAPPSIPPWSLGRR